MSHRESTGEEVKVLQARQIFLASVESLAETPDQLVAAVSYGLSRVFDQLVRQACAEVDLEPETFTEALERDPAAQSGLQARLNELFSDEAITAAKAHAQRKEAERHLYVLRYVLCGKEPAAWVLETMDPQEEAKLRAFRARGGEDDPVLLERVERALAKVAEGRGYGQCEDCGAEVSPERLALMPWAQRCTRCQRKREEPSEPPGGPRVQLMMFFEGGKPVPPDRRLLS